MLAEDRACAARDRPGRAQPGPKSRAGRRAGRRATARGAARAAATPADEAVAGVGRAATRREAAPLAAQAPAREPRRLTATQSTASSQPVVAVELPLLGVATPLDLLLLEEKVLEQLSRQTPWRGRGRLGVVARPTLPIERSQERDCGDESPCGRARAGEDRRSCRRRRSARSSDQIEPHPRAPDRSFEANEHRLVRDHRDVARAYHRSVLRLRVAHVQSARSAADLVADADADIAIRFRRASRRTAIADGVDRVPRLGRSAPGSSEPLRDRRGARPCRGSRQGAASGPPAGADRPLVPPPGR